MDAIAGLTFRAAPVLWALAALPLVALFFFARESTRRRLADRFVSERMRGYASYRVVRPLLLTLAVLFAVGAAAGPRLGERVIAVQQREANTIVALDVSLSMAAEDVGTSRLSASKAIIRKLVERRGGKVALVAFEGKAQVISPLTSDEDAVLTLLDSLGPGELAEPGSDFGAAIDESLKLARTTGGARPEILLISDGENRSDGLDQSLRRARAANLKVDTVMVGTEGGSKIPLPDAPGEVLRDESGEDVVTVASPKTMQSISSATSGRFFANPFSEHQLASVASTLSSSGRMSKQEDRVPIERYQWPLAAAVFALLLGSLANRGAE